MKVLIHDYEGDITSVLHTSDDDITIISDDDTIKNCIGCFGCWVKTPGACVIRDNYGDLGELMSKAEKLIVVSKCYYGGVSPFVKNILDRSISYLHPYFEIRNNELHHKSRYESKFELQYIFYGDITEKERETATKLVKANALNLNCKSFDISFVNGLAEMEGFTI